MQVTMTTATNSITFYAPEKFFSFMLLLTVRSKKSRARHAAHLCFICLCFQGHCGHAWSITTAVSQQPLTMSLRVLPLHIYLEKAVKACS